MDSHQLELFRCLGRELSFKRVAKRMELTPSAVSHALKALETDLGCRLLERNARRVSLTEAGRQLLMDAEHILGLMSEARQRVVARTAQVAEVLRLGLMPEHASRILPLVVREFRESFPGQRFVVREVPDGELERMLADDELDLAFIAEPRQADSLGFSMICEEEFRYVTHPLHPWALQRSAGAGDAVNRRMIVSSHDPHTLSMFAEFHAAEGTGWEPWLELPSYEAVKESVLLDLGIGVLPTWYVGEEIREKWVYSFPFGRRKLRRRWGFVSSGKRSLTLQENTFCTLFKKAVLTTWSKVGADMVQKHVG